MRSFIFLFFAVSFVLSCTDKKTEKKVLKIEQQGVAQNDSKLFHNKIKFGDYPTEVYKGKLAEPNVKDNPFAGDREYDARFQKQVKEAGINFGGQYTAFTMSCGAMCVSLYIVDRKTGKIYSDIGIDTGKYGYEFRKDSNLLIANSELFIDDTLDRYNEYLNLEPEFYVWGNDKFELIKQKSPK